MPGENFSNRGALKKEKVPGTGFFRDCPSQDAVSPFAPSLIRLDYHRLK